MTARASRRVTGHLLNQTHTPRRHQCRTTALKQWKKSAVAREAAPARARGRSPPRGRSRSPPRRSRSPPRGRSPPRDRSRSRSRGRSPPRGRSRSPPRDGREPPSPREPRGEGEDAERKPRVPPEEEVGRQVYVGNLNFNTDKKMMEDAVGEYGKIRDIYMPADNDGRPRGFCFVTFEEKTQAEACALGMNGRELDGRVVRCNIARPRPTPDERRRRRDDYDRPRGRRPPDGRIFVEGCPTTSRSASSMTSSTAGH